MNPNVKRGIEENLQRVPYEIMIGFQRLSKALNYLNLNLNINYNLNNNLNLNDLNQFYNPKNEKIKYPGIDDFIKYGKEHNYTDIDLEKCWHHYNANGWRQSNGLQIVQWHSVFATWRANNKRYNNVTPKLKDIQME